MTTNLENNTISRVTSLEVQDSNKKVNSVSDVSVSALINHKDRYGEKTNESIKQSGLYCPLPNSNKAIPHKEVSIDFAAKQLFQILLVHVKYIHSKSLSDLDLLPVPSESNPLIINI